MTLRPSTVRILEFVALVAILLLAGVARMGWPGLTEFKADEARLLILALDMAGGQFQLRGISSSVGFPNFPMSVWLYALPVLLWPHPYAATIFPGLLNTVSVAGAYWLVRRYWGRTAALSAALLYAVSPWGIIYSRKIWAQDLLPLFVMGWGIAAALAFVEGRHKWIILHLLCLAIAIQIHLSAVALIPATILFLLVFRRQLSWRWVLVGGALGVLTAVPFLYYLWQQWRGGGIEQLALSGSEATTTSMFNSLRYTIMVSLGTDAHSLAGPDAFRAFLAQAPPVVPAQWFLAGLIIAGIIWLLFYLWRRWGARAAQVGFILLVWLLLPPLFFLLPLTQVFPHYFITTFPAQYMIGGIAFAWLVARFGKSRYKVAFGVGWGLLLLTAALQLWLSFNLLQFVMRINTPGGMGTPLALKLEAAETATTLVRESGAAEILLAGEGEFPGIDAFPAEWTVLLREWPHRFVDAHSSALFPAQPTVILLDGRLEQNAPIEPVRQLYSALTETQETIPLRSGEGSYVVMALPTNNAAEPDTRFDNPILLANFVQLVGYGLRCEVGALHWRLHWQTADNPDGADYHLFNHLLDANGQRIAQSDAAVFAPAQWRAGDKVISYFTLPLPEAAAAPWLMRVGMYRFPSLEAVPILDIAANPAGDWLEIPLSDCS